MNVDRPGRRIRMPWESRSKADVRPRDDSSTLVSRRVRTPGLHGATKDHFVAMLAEFVGTFLFLLFAFGGTNAVNNTPNKDQENLNADPARLLYIALCFGMSLAVNAVSYTPSVKNRHWDDHVTYKYHYSGSSSASAVASSTRP